MVFLEALAERGFRIIGELMNLEKLEKLGLDYKTGLSRFLGNSGVYFKFLNSFAYEPDSEKLKKAVETKDREAVFQTAHALKGITGNLSLNLLYEKICLVVEDTRHDWNKKTQSDFDDYYASYLDVLSALKED